MTSKNIRIILILMLVTIGALFMTQVYWFKKSFDLNEGQLDKKINNSLRKVAHQLKVLDNDLTSKIPPITKTSSNEFKVDVNTYFTLSSLDSLLKKDFFERGLTMDFDYFIIQPASEKIILGNGVSGNISHNEVACKTRFDGKENLNFKILLRNKSAYLLESMEIWIFSSLSLLIVLAVFTFIIASIFRGKKLELLKKDFVNNMTHELKTPIANIALASDALRSRNNNMDEEKLNKYADIIYKENVRLHNLVDGVLQVSAMEKNDEALQIEDLSFHDILKEVIGSFQPLIKHRNGQLKLHLEAKNDHIQGDKVHLTNVMNNLIDNAIKYTKGKPEIKLNTSNSKQGITIEVIDNGIGVSKENQHRIFDKFYREQSGDIHETKGFGLGLSYVKLIIEKHRGIIKYKSNLGKGSRFILFLPY